jgi:hypothetical protein
MASKYLRLALLGVIVLTAGACSDDDPQPTPGPTATATLVAPTVTAVPPTHSPTATPEATDTEAPGQTPTDVPGATATPFPLESATSTPLPTDTPEPEETPTLTIAEILAAGGADRYLGVEPDSMRINNAWEEYFYDPADAGPICLRGTEYQVNLRRGTSANLLIYLEGGGACWNHATCWEAPTAKLVAGPALAISGALQAGNPENPFADWDVVYAPYCDGSVFAGDNIADYQGNPTYHHGLRNLSAAVSLALREFPEPPMIVVSGSSAGGFGTYSGYAVTRVAYPTVPLYVLNDSGPGLQNPGDPVSAMERSMNWGFGQLIPADCADCTVQLTYLTDWALDRDPMLRVGYFNYLQDAVLQVFLRITGPAFQALLLEITDDLRTRHPERFKRFFPAGSSHTILLGPTFYSEALEGITMNDWTADFLTGGPNWQDLVE